MAKKKLKKGFLGNARIVTVTSVPWKKVKETIDKITKKDRMKQN